MTDCKLNELLEKEKDKLNELADKALKKGIPLTQDEEFMAQNDKVDGLIVKIQQDWLLQNKSNRSSRNG
ncbi:MAG TPA: hypothetical protein VN370_10205 [Desulfitobacteriaceae bacterium]|jgi:hypothetical protein|nr:hypothetical protein [Desulfitobacteriaceae bacterium]